MIIPKTGIWLSLTAAALFLTACGAGKPQGTSAPAEQSAPPAATSPARPTDSPPPTAPAAPPPAPSRPATNRRVEPDRTYRIPPPLIPPDGIAPVYDPRFAPAADAPLQDDELVIGIAIQGEAKAYPITVLRFREMVNDELAGIPILVTW